MQCRAKQCKVKHSNPRKQSNTSHCFYEFATPDFHSSWLGPHWNNFWLLGVTLRRCHVWLIGVFAQVRGGSQVFPGRAPEARRMGSGGLPWPPGPPDPESKDLIDLDSGPDFSFEFFGALDSISRANFRKIKHMVLGPAGNRRFVGVWAAPAAPKTHSKRWGGLAPPPSGMVGGAAGAAQTPRDREREREREGRAVPLGVARTLLGSGATPRFPTLRLRRPRISLDRSTISVGSETTIPAMFFVFPGVRTLRLLLLPFWFCVFSFVALSSSSIYTSSLS